MNKITCDVCMDLLPLVKDQVASEGSVKAVKEHMKTCENCRLESKDSTEVMDEVDDDKVIKRIKKKLLYSMIIILLIGSVFGIALSNSMGMFYNFIIMPILGAIGYLALSEKWYYVPIGIFAMSYVWLLVTFFIEGAIEYSSVGSWLVSPLFLGSIYTFLSMIGACISWLLKYAFGKVR